MTCRLNIVIPTYNRARHLTNLLGALVPELAGLQDRVQVLVADNDSPDGTPAVTQAFAAAVPGTRIIRHESNVGPDENFSRCVELADADYFWMIGDDDLPREGAVRRLLDLLDRHEPDLLYLPSEWHEALDASQRGPRLGPLAPRMLHRLAFTRHVNVWSTFISGWVVRRAPYVDGAGAAGLRRFVGTNLVQLSWILGTAAVGRRLMVLREPIVLATKGNSGGYGMVTVFGGNFASVVEAVFGAESREARAMVSRCMLGYLPGTVHTVRFGDVGDYHREDILAALGPRLAKFASYRLLVAIARAPVPLARASFFICRVLGRLQRIADRLSERLGGARRLPA